MAIDHAGTDGGGRNLSAYPHIRIVMGMVVGLGVTRLLSGFARIVQHPGRPPFYGVHLAWGASALLMLVHFWWWEFGLFRVEPWTFEIYIFIIAYAILLFLLCAFLLPENLSDYADYKDYFLSRRAWFFGVLAATYVFDFFDTLLKGRAHLEQLGQEYLWRLAISAMLCCVAVATRNRVFHAVFVAATLLYQVSFILRRFNTLS